MIEEGDGKAIEAGIRRSSYPGCGGTGARFEMVEEGPMLALAGGQGDGRRTAYRRFVEEGLKNPDEEFRGEMWKSSRASEMKRSAMGGCLP